jgi:flagellar hook assembly protein FlgD
VATRLSDNFPNPFNPATRVRFSLASRGPVSLRVYDVSGRLVRILIDDIRDAGSYEVAWDGTNDEGRSIASGIYFCRMETTGYERSLKMVLLR